MGIINVLDKHMAELIAAGEVVERPASVIKEMVENSIDAGATVIIVEIKNGGVSFMRVADNGSGIMRDDVKKAFLRHATSKIKDQNDLDRIGTLGFRGEALASISAVSDLTLITRCQEDFMGTSYRIRGGEEVQFEDVGCPVGTTFIVRELFYNIPARMKFLKKDVSEGNAVSAIMDRLALAHPEISFTYIKDGKTALKTTGDGKLRSAVYSVFGREFVNTLIPVDYSLNGVHVYGFVSKPVHSRPNRNMQNFFINGRYVKTKTGTVALEEACKGSVMVGKFPACVLNIDLDFAMVDVNVHPSKTEVRFVNEKPVFDAVYHGVKSSLIKEDTNKQAFISSNKPPVGEPAVKKVNPFEMAQMLFRKRDDEDKEKASSRKIEAGQNASDTKKLENNSGNGIYEQVERKDNNFHNDIWAALDIQDKTSEISETPKTDETLKASEASEALKNNLEAVPKIYKDEENKNENEEREIDLDERKNIDVTWNPKKENSGADEKIKKITPSDEYLKALKERLIKNMKEQGSFSSAEDEHDFNDVEKPQESKYREYRLEEKKVDNSGEQVLNEAKSLYPKAETASFDINQLETEICNDTPRFIGELFNTYIILETPEKEMLLIDKHAAHERILYEKLKKEKGRGFSQILLEPVRVVLDKTDYDSCVENLEVLKDAGFEVEDFGYGTVIVRSAPQYLDEKDIYDSIVEMAGYISKNKKDISTERIDWIYHNMACRAAVKGGNINSPEELMEIVRMLQENPQLRYCPHGRPIVVSISKREIEKQFGRV